MNINQALNWAVKKLDNHSSSPHLDAEVLLSFVAKKDRTWLYANHEKKLSKLQATTYYLLIAKRSKNWPIAYLTGHKEFYGLDFKLTKDVLIPRPETELIIEHALKNIFPLQEMERDQGRGRKLNIIDLGTGSGAIIISLAVIAIRRRRRSNLKFFATDISKKALGVAKQNAKSNKVANKIKFMRGNLLAPLAGHWSLGFGHSLLLANLPYLTPAQVKANPDLKHEPKLALTAGNDGLKYYRELFKQLSHVIANPSNPRIIMLIEHDPSQKTKLGKLMKNYFPKAKIKFHKDLSGRYRVMEARFNG